MRNKLLKSMIEMSRSQESRVLVFLAKNGGSAKFSDVFDELNEDFHVVEMHLNTLLFAGYISTTGETRSLTEKGKDRAAELWYDGACFEDDWITLAVKGTARHGFAEAFHDALLDACVPDEIMKDLENPILFNWLLTKIKKEIVNED